MRAAMSQPNGPLSLLAGPMHVSDTSLRCELPPPLLGQHTDEVLRELLALSDGKPRALRARRVV
jgi:formyl-CoA transferase